jgi:hypothetical protein
VKPLISHHTSCALEVDGLGCSSLNACSSTLLDHLQLQGPCKVLDMASDGPALTVVQAEHKPFAPGHQQPPMLTA